MAHSSMTLDTLPDNMTIFIDNVQCRITTNDELGSGGEGSVFLNPLDRDDSAIKILLPKFRMQWRINKLMEQIKLRTRLPEQVYLARKLVEDDAHDVVGYEMKQVNHADYKILTWYTKKQFRDDNPHITDDHVLQIFARLAQLLNEIHKADMVVGDFNPGGVMVLDPSLWTDKNMDDIVIIVDTDSFQMNQYPCQVYSLLWIDYQIESKLNRLGIDNIYSKNTDWFTFDAMFMAALLHANVYDAGFHEYFDTPALRLKNGYTLIHPDVEYPLDIVPFDTLPEKLQKRFKTTMVDGARTPFDMSIFNSMLGTNFKLDRDVKPQVNATGIRIMQTLYSKLTNIVDIAMIGNELYVLDKISDTEFAVYTDHGKMAVRSHDPVDYASIGGINMVNTYSKSGVVSHTSSDTMSINTVKGRKIHLGGIYNNHKYYVNQQSYLVSENLVQQYPVPVELQQVTNNTDLHWFIDGDRPAGMGITRVMRTQYAFAWINQVPIDVELPDLEGTEYIVSDRNIEVYYHKGSFLIARYTEFQGAPRTRLTLVEASESRAVSKTYDDLIIDTHINSYYGIAFAYGNAFYSSDAGIVMRDVKSWGNKVFSETRNIVTRDMKLRLFNKGILAFNRSDVIYLEL